MKNFLFFLLIILCFGFSQSSRILVVAPMPSHSHFMVAFRLAKELADRGHQVTTISPYPQAHLKNYRDIPVLENIQIMEEEKKTLYSKGRQKMSENLFSLFKMTSSLTQSTLANENVRQLLMSSNESFDVIIVEHFLNDALVGLGHHFKAPVILLSSVISNVMNNYIFANPAPVSYVPSKGGTLTKHMTFWQRIQNLFMTVVFDIVMEFHHLPIQRQIFKRYIDNSLELDDVLYNVSLMLTNSHVSVSDAVPLVPSIKEIGGYHVMPPKKLPDDLRAFLDDAEDGVVVFSMGSALKSKDLSSRMIDNLLRVFGRIKQKVLWKFEDELELPKNVKVMKWLPQQDVLAHPNVRVFMTHGGFLSCIEAVYFGVPIVGIPVFGDQKYNIAAAVSNGYAVRVNLNELTEENLFRALNEIFENPEYRDNAQKRSKLMRDRPMEPIDEAVFWVEHVIRHKGASHLRSAGLDLKWYQRQLIDVFLFLFLIFVAVVLIIYIGIRKLDPILFPRKKIKTVTKNKKNK